MKTPETQGPKSEPVTTIFARIVKTYRIQDFEGWLKGINEVVRQFDGYLGMDVIRPGDYDRPEYVTILRFENYDDIKQWQESPDRSEWIEKSNDLTVGDPYLQEAHGLESWFPLPDRQTAVLPPVKYKMAVLTVAAIYPLILLVGTAVTLLPQGLPSLIATLITVIVVGTSMTYFVMLWITRLFRFWLFPSSGS